MLIDTPFKSILMRDRRVVRSAFETSEDLVRLQVRHRGRNVQQPAVHDLSSGRGAVGASGGNNGVSVGREMWQIPASLGMCHSPTIF